MKLVILNKINSVNLVDFILGWSKLYSYANEPIYVKSITKEVFTKIDIQNLYEWKNGMLLSELKQKSLDAKIKTKLSIINNFKRIEDIDIIQFNKEFKNLSAVWKIFLLHIIKPSQYPIYDQHIHRSFLYIHKEDWASISYTSINNKSKEQFYFNRYLPFIRENEIRDLKKLDEAFFAFGQFLNTRNYAMLLE